MTQTLLLLFTRDRSPLHDFRKPTRVSEFFGGSAHCPPKCAEPSQAVRWSAPSWLESIIANDTNSREGRGCNNLQLFHRGFRYDREKRSI